MSSANDDSLLRFVASHGGDKSLKVEENLGDGFVRLRVAEAERRQAKHDIRCSEDIVVEMLRNSRDAGAHKIFVATTHTQDIRTITILDDGDGIPVHMQERIFDARVTSKLDSIHMDRWGVHGRGMALFSIHENAQSAKVLASDLGLGASIQVVSNTQSLSERADQSSWPSLDRDDEGKQRLGRGPHNIIRSCCEFALEERGVCDVYVGSPAEIAATIRRRMSMSLSPSDLLFVDSLNELPILERIAAAADASELLEVCLSLGLDMSERTAHRILSGAVHPTRSVLAKLLHAGSGDKREVDLTKDSRGLKISKNDQDEFCRQLEKDFQILADRYYLNLLGDPRLRVSRGKITVSFDFEEGD